MRRAAASAPSAAAALQGATAAAPQPGRGAPPLAAPAASALSSAQGVVDRYVRSRAACAACGALAVIGVLACLTSGAGAAVGAPQLLIDGVPRRAYGARAECSAGPPVTLAAEKQVRGANVRARPSRRTVGACTARIAARRSSARPSGLLVFALTHDTPHTHTTPPFPSPALSLPCPYPIYKADWLSYDAVYTYHNRESSPSVREAYAAALAEEHHGIVRNVPINGTAKEEDDDMDVFALSVKLARRNLLGLRTIHVIVDYADEVPAEVAAMPDVRVVLSRDMYPSEALANWPYFSAYAKEAYLHRVPGLAEAFVFLNDDMLITRPIEPPVFFPRAGGLRWMTGYEHKDESWLHVAKRLFKGAQGGPTARAYAVRAGCAGCKQCERTLLRDGYYPSHAPRPFLRSYLVQMERRHPEAFLSVFSTRFRCKECLQVHSLMLVPAAGFLRMAVEERAGGGAIGIAGATDHGAPGGDVDVLDGSLAHIGREVFVWTEPAKRHALIGYFVGARGASLFEKEWARWPFITVQEASARNHADIYAFMRRKLNEPLDATPPFSLPPP